MKTPARIAASRANLEKARAAPKEKVYRPTEKRLAANRANLSRARARRQQELEETIDRLDQAFPPLGEQVEGPSPGGSGGEPSPAPEGTTPHSEGANGASEANAQPEMGNPGVDPAGPEKDGFKNGGVGRRFWVIGWPDGRQGVDRGARGYGELEKVGRALVRRGRSVQWDARREARRVTRLLTEAAARTVAPAVYEILALACALMSVLANCRILGRVARLNRHINRLLDAFLQKRYGEVTGQIFDLMAEVRQMGAFLRESKESSRQMEEELRARRGLPPRPDRARGGSRARPKPQCEQDRLAEPAAEKKPSRPPGDGTAGGGTATGPDLPETLEELRALLGRAFFAPQPVPEDEAVGALLNELAEKLWERLHLFEARLQGQAERLDEALDEMAQAVPASGDELVARRCMIEVLLKVGPDDEETLVTCNQEIAQHLNVLIRGSYGRGLGPAIDRFVRGDDALSA